MNFFFITSRPDCWSIVFASMVKVLLVHLNLCSRRNKQTFIIYFQDRKNIGRIFNNFVFHFFTGK